MTVQQGGIAAAPGPDQGLMSAAAIRAELTRRWIALTLIAWAIVSTYYLHDRWAQVRWLGLGDTDDNIRLMQVRALLAGQRWGDLRQYRLNPPTGFDIHWTRLVDLPIAGLILALRPFAGPVWAERIACGVAPLLPLSVAMLGIGAVVRRLVAPVAWPLGIVILLCCTATLLMFMPERIDHHGWQLALLGLTLAGSVDPRGGRGGVTVGLASAASLTIGLEMLPYAAAAGALLALRWVWDVREGGRVQAYALALGGGSALGYALFASDANRVLRCDALTPVWLSVMVAAGVLLFALAQWAPAGRGARLGWGLAAGVAIAAGFALCFPQCLGRPEQVSPELARNWLGNVREAKPVYSHPFDEAFGIVVLPIIGLGGALWASWRARGTAAWAEWASAAAFSVLACGLMVWQTRAGPAAQLLAVPGATALAWVALPWCLGHRNMLVRVFGTAAAFLLVTGLFAGYVVQWVPQAKPNPAMARVRRAGGRCPAYASLTPLNQLPPQTIFTMVDLGPRLITLTHHSAIAGPYHRNGDAILDVQHAFTGSPAQFRAIARAHGASLLLLCPNMAEGTVYRARAPQGFYARMADGWRPGWLEPIALPKGSPLRLYRIR